MTIKLTQFPAVKILIILLPSIVIGSFFSWNEASILAVLSISLLFSIFFIFTKKKNIAYIILIIAVGISVSYRLDKLIVKAPEKIIPEFPALMKGEITKIIRSDINYCKCIINGNIDGKLLPKVENTGIILTIINLKKKNLHLSAGMKIAGIVKAKIPKSSNLPTDFPEKQYCASLDVQWLARANSKNISIVSRPRGFYFIRENLVKRIQNKIAQLFNAGSQGIVTALITGDKSKIPYETKQNFSLTGTAHVLAVSGLHVGIIASIIFLMLGIVRNRYIKFLIFTLLVTVFVIITGFQPSAIRAGIMAVLAMLCYCLERRVYFLNILALTVLILIIFSPEMLYSAGFQMSVASIAGIALLFKPFQKFFKIFFKSENPFINYFTSSLSITFAASVTVAPIVAYYFGIYSFISPLANLIIIPLITLAMIFSLTAMAASLVSIWLALNYAACADLLLLIAQKINNMAVSLPYAFASGKQTILIAFIISAAILFIFLSQSKRQLIFRFSTSIFIGVLLFHLLLSEVKQTTVVPREQLTAAFIKLNNSKSLVLLSDRKPKQYPYRDFGMEKYLTEYPDSLFIAYSGKAGRSICDRIKINRNIKYFSASHDFQNKIQKLINIKDKLPQVIESE